MEPGSSARATLLKAVVLALAAVPALAHPDLDAARSAYAKGDVHAALAKLEDAQRSGAADQDLVDVHWYRALCFRALGRNADASAAVDDVLALRPLYTPNFVDAPPDLRKLFLARQRAYKDKYGVELGKPVLHGRHLSFTLTGHPQAVAEVLVLIRPAGEVTFTTVRMDLKGAQASTELTDRALLEQVAAVGALELTAEARNRRGAPVASFSEQLHPHVLTVPAGERDRLLEGLPPPPSKPELSTATPEPGAAASPSPASASTQPEAAPVTPAAAPAPARPSTGPSPARHAVRAVAVLTAGLGLTTFAVSALLLAGVLGLRGYDVAASGGQPFSTQHAISLPLAVGSNLAQVASILLLAPALLAPLVAVGLLAVSFVLP